ncbi:MAG: hypothetical protein AAGG51_26330, partial [Cyanobacteria bacterium P01_G01_bin.54]
MSSLKAGLAALKQKSYDVAIQKLETFCSGSSQTQTRSYCQAQMGLMQAYAATHDYPQSLKACQFLLLSPSTQVQQWAAQHSFPVIKAALPEADTDRDKILVQLHQLIHHQKYQPLHDLITTINQDFISPTIINQDPPEVLLDSEQGRITTIQSRVARKSPKMQARYRQIRADQNLKQQKKSLCKLALKGIKRISIALGVLLFIWVTLGNLAANYYVAKTEREIEEEWAHVLTGDYNEATYHLQEIATWKLGFKLIDWDYEDEHPIDMDVNLFEAEEWNEIRPILYDYLDAQYKFDVTRISEPPTELQFYLRNKDELLNEIHEILKQQAPRTRNDFYFYTTGFTPSHSFGFGYLRLQRILSANILFNQFRGNQSKVKRDLETLWILNQSMSQTNSLLDWLLYFISTKYLLLTLQEVEELPSVWHKRLDE